MIYLIALYLVSTQNWTFADDSPAMTALRQDVKCFVSKDAKACESRVLPNGVSDIDRQYHEVGCLEGNSADSCTNLGTWYMVNHDPIQAKTHWEKACAMKWTEGCRRLFEMKFAKVDEKAPPQQMAAFVAEAQAAYSEQCSTEKLKADRDCILMEAHLAELKDQLNPVQRDCEMNYLVFQSQNEPPKPSLNKLKNKMTNTECQRRCSLLVAAVAKGPLDLGIRGQCLFGGSPLGQEIWRQFETQACQQDDQTFLGDPHKYYQPCFCESLSHRSVNDLTKPFGVVGVAQTRDAKVKNGTKWYHCGIGFFYLDPSIRADPSKCQNNLDMLKKNLAATEVAKEFGLDFTNLVCDQVKL
jgi:hypothetical protein